MARRPRETPHNPSPPLLWDSGHVISSPDHVSEPASKRRKIEDENSASRSGPQDLSPPKLSPQSLDSLSHDSTGLDYKHSTPYNNQPGLRQHDREPSKHGLPLFPRRPQILSSMDNAELPDPGRRSGAILGDVQKIAYVAEASPSKPQYRHGVGKAFADFHPWIGNHAEDVLNESTIRNGLFDRLHGNQNDIATARPAIWSSLKNKSGLQTLSSLFVSVLDQREAHGTIAANCTFKPPPRVTLTDTKRETWLRGLADSHIPLRRLSRSIPHGIRGKILLDHCLAKEIPVARAVWLAKCVGANEIRAFKRKGTGGAFAIGGELKWIKDWTTNVEQFLEAIISTCGSAGWKTRMDYGLRLASHLASDHVLDRDHFLNWIISSIQSSHLDNLATWLCIARLHYQDLLQHSQYGRGLVQVLLEHLYQILAPANEQICSHLVKHLSDLLKLALLSVPGCFLLPRTWNTYEPLLRQSLNDNAEVLMVPLSNVSERNMQLQSQVVHRFSTSKQKVIQLLDSAGEDINIFQLVDTALYFLHSTDALVFTCLEWGSSAYRTGNARVYLSARILRICSNSKDGLDASVLQFLAAAAHHKDLSTSVLYRILAELFRSKHLSVGKYLQWLMARGRVNTRPITEECPCDTQLLFELPTSGLTLPVANLRNILLSRFGASIELEREAICSLQKSISNRIPEFFSLSSTGREDEPDLQSLDQSTIPVKSTIAQWIRQVIASRFDQERSDMLRSGGSTPESRQATSITIKHLKLIAQILESMEDFTILADVLRIVLKTDDVAFLTFACDTVLTHLPVFAAIGALQDLFFDLCEQYESIRKSIPAHINLLDSLIDLGRNTPNRKKEVRHLRSLKQRYYQRTAAAACSPISDHWAEAIQTTEPNFLEEVDQILANSSGMDKTNLIQLFETVMQRSKLAPMGEKQLNITFAEVLARLRPFEPTTFDNLLSSWVHDVLQSPTGYHFIGLLLPLVGTGCITLIKVLDLGQDVLQKTPGVESKASIAMGLLQFFTFPEHRYSSTTASRGYRLCLQRALVLRQSPSLVVPLIQAAVDACLDPQEDLRTRAKITLLDHSVQSLIITLAERDSLILQKVGSSSGAAAFLHELLYPWDATKDDLQIDGSQLRQLMLVVNYYNMTLCQLRLRNLLVNGTASPDSLVHHLKSISTLDREHGSGDLLPQLVSQGLPSEFRESVRQRLEREVLSKSLHYTDEKDCHSQSMVHRLVSMVEAIGLNASEPSNFAVVSQVADKCAQLLNLHRQIANEPRAAHDRDLISPETLSNLDIILRLLRAHQITIEHPQFPQPVLVKILLSLSLFLIQLARQPQTQLSTSANDISLVLSDSLSEESRSRCIQSLQEQKIDDPQIRFIFGYPEVLKSEWLQLVHDHAKMSEARAAGVAVPSMTTTTFPYPVRKWEMIQDATPIVGANDTSISLTLFGTRKSVL